MASVDGEKDMFDPGKGRSANLTRITRNVACTRITEGRVERFEDRIPIEEPFAIILNGEHAIDVTMTPDDVEDFVIGHLICEGLIDDPRDLECFDLGEGWAEARFKQREKPLARETIFSACFGSTKPRARVERLESILKLNQMDVQGAIELLNSKAHQLTGGVHTCAIFLHEGNAKTITKMVSMVDDIGRHTALDKAVGRASRAGCDFGRCFVVTTGRASSEMVAKCYGAGIPVIASRGATTTLAIEVARLSGITLIGFARRGRMNVYCNENRIQVSK